MKIKIIIPIYNDWQSAFKLFEEIDNLKIDKNFEISIIVVNDASNHDRPNEEVNFNNIQSIKILNMKKNQGHARCIATGLKYILDKEPEKLFQVAFSLIIFSTVFFGKQVKFPNFIDLPVKVKVTNLCN